MKDQDNTVSKNDPAVDGAALLCDSGGVVLRQCRHTKQIRLSNSVEIGFFYNECGNSFLGSLMFQGIPHFHEIAVPENEERGFKMLADSTVSDAIGVFDEIMTWPSMKHFTKSDVINYWNGNY